MRCFRRLVSLLHITSSIADDNVKNNDQVIMPGLETGTFWVNGRHDKDNNKKSRQDQVKIFLIMLNWVISKKLICKFKVYTQKDSLFFPDIDKMAEWLRLRTVNPLGSARVGSSPIFVVFLFGSMVKWIAILSLNSALKVEISEKNCYL